jgi:hypothetical protein
METDLAIPNGREFTAQQTWWGTVLGRRCEGINNADARFRLERGDEIVKQGVRLFDLVIHVHQNRNVHRISWQLRIVRLTEGDYNVLQSEIAYPLTQALQILRDDVFCDDATFRFDDRRQPYDVVAAPGADVCDVIPDLMPSRRTSWTGSPALSRSFSSCQIGLTMSATGRSGFGKATAGTPGGAMKSCGPPEMVNAAAKTTPIVIIRIMLPELRC